MFDNVGRILLVMLGALSNYAADETHYICLIYCENNNILLLLIFVITRIFYYPEVNK